MAEYLLHTDWFVAAPIDCVWDAIYDVKRWPSWWPYVRRVVEIEPGNDNGLGAVRRFTWASRLPYSLSFDMRVTRIDPPHRLEGSAMGELDGTGIWTLHQLADATRTHYEWRVRTTRPWMNLLAPIARPVFAWNHGEVMKAGAEGLAKLLAADVKTRRD